MFGLEIWNYAELRRERNGIVETPEHEQQPGVDLTGFSVEALDGPIGTVAGASYDVDSSSIVVDTGPWIFGRKVLVPAGIIDRIDLLEEIVYVLRSREEIKGSPEFQESVHGDTVYRAELELYYGPGGRGYRELETPRLTLS